MKNRKKLFFLCYLFCICCSVGWGCTHCILRCRVFVCSDYPPNMHDNGYHDNDDEVSVTAQMINLILFVYYHYFILFLLFIVIMYSVMIMYSYIFVLIYFCIFFILINSVIILYTCHFYFIVKVLVLTTKRISLLFVINSNCFILSLFSVTHNSTRITLMCIFNQLIQMFLS